MPTKKAVKPASFNQKVEILNNITQLLKELDGLIRYQGVSDIQLYIPTNYLKYFVRYFKEKHGVVNIVYYYNAPKYFKLYVSKRNLKIFRKRLEQVIDYLKKKEIIT